MTGDLPPAQPGAPEQDAVVEQGVTIEKLLLESPRVVGLFTAPWCGVDRQVRSLQSDDEPAQVVVVDVDQHPHVADRFRVDVLPTLLLLESGREIGRRIGAFGRSDVQDAVSELTSI